MDTNNDDNTVSIPCNTKNTTTQNVNNINFTNRKSLKMMYLNAQSLSNKIEDVERLISQLKDELHIIAVTETWFANNISKKQIITNFNKISAFRPNRTGGGASIYVNKSMSFRECFTWSNDDDSIVKIELFDDKKICDIMCIYRPPRPLTQSFGDFVRKLDEVLDDCETNTIVIGDMNINLFNDDIKSKRYLETLYSNGFTVCNRYEVTRPASSSNIDHILTNNCTTPMNIMQLEHYISDHNVIFTEVNHLQVKLNKIITKTQTKIDFQKLKSNLENNNNNFNNTDLNATQNYDNFFLNLKTKLNEATKQRTIKLSGRHLKPWTDAELKTTMDATAFWYNKYSRDRQNDLLKDEYKRWDAKLKLMKIEKWTAYNSQKIQQNLGDSRKTWAVIKTNILGEEQKSERIVIQDGGAITSEKPKIAEKFNSFFTSVADGIASNLPDVQRQQLSTPIPPTDHKILYPATESEVKNTIKLLKNTTSVGHDNISTLTLKECADAVTPALTVLINQSLNEGIFPNQLKIAKIIPIYKSSDRTLIENYRPIALLSVVSKIYEKIARARLIQYLDDNRIIDQRQYGFRSRSNTESALFDLVNRIQALTQKKRKVGVVFYDLRKAFDTVNLEILLEILQNIGLHGTDLAWFRSYLCGRTQYVEIDGTRSSERPVTSSVPQGSVLGPILFLLYVNQIQHLDLEGEPQLYADDIAIVYTNETHEAIKHDIQQDFAKLSDWTASMKLSINFDKTKIMLIKQDRIIEPPIKFNNCDVHFVNNFKYLGVDLDSKMNFIPYLDNLKKKLSQIAGLFKKMRNVIPLKLKKPLFEAFFNSHIQYGLNIWGVTFNYLIEGIQIIQNKAIKNLFNYHYLENTNKVHQETKILPLTLSHFIKSCCLVHNVQKEHVHSNTKIRPNNNFHDHNLRNNNNLRNETNNSTGFRTKPLLYTYINNYNKIDQTIKIENKVKFRKKLKEKIQEGFFKQNKTNILQIFP